MKNTCQYSEHDRDDLREIKNMVSYLKDSHKECLIEFQRNQETLNNTLAFLERHFSRFGSSLEKMTDRIDLTLSKGVVPMTSLNRIVMLFILMAASFVILTFVSIIGLDGVGKLANILQAAPTTILP